MEAEIGRVTRYDSHSQVAMLMLKRVLKVGDEIRIHGHVIDFTQLVTSMEINRVSVLWAQPGDDVELAVIGPVYENDRVYKVVMDK